MATDKQLQRLAEVIAKQQQRILDLEETGKEIDEFSDELYSENRQLKKENIRLMEEVDGVELIRAGFKTRIEALERALAAAKGADV